MTTKRDPDITDLTEYAINLANSWRNGNMGNVVARITDLPAPAAAFVALTIVLELHSMEDHGSSLRDWSADRVNSATGKAAESTTIHFLNQLRRRAEGD